MRVLPLLLLALASLLPVPAALAGLLRGTVSYVTDGDTLWVRPAPGREAVQVRLLHIDAPETCQAFGPQARQALARRVLNRRVTVRTAGQDDYGRVLGVVRLRGQDVNAWLVRQGHAWASSRPGQPNPYAALEAQARRARRGLWAQPGAEPPRAFRRRHGSCR